MARAEVATAAGFSEGQRVRLVGHPRRYGWMAPLIFKVGVVEEVDTLEGRDVPVYGVSGLVDGENGDLLWFGASFLEHAEGLRKEAG